MLNDYNHCDHLFLVFIHQKVSIGHNTYLISLESQLSLGSQ